jgi:hypothetical protein
MSSDYGAVGFEPGESERQVAGEQLLFVANAHIAFSRLGEAILE